MRRFILSIIFCSIIFWGGNLSAGPMALTTDGHLYKVWASPEEGLVLSHVANGAEDEAYIIPQTLGIGLESVNIAIDERTQSVFILWSDDRNSISRVRLVELNQGTWFGPLTLGGNDGVSAFNPQLLLDRASSEIGPIDPQDDPVILEDTFLHLVWWRHDTSDGMGHAVYLPLRLDSEGLPLLNEDSLIDLQDLLPFGVGCDSTPDIDGLAHPQFLRAADGNPLLFTTDFSNCVFHILSIQYEVEESDNSDGFGKRRRQIAVFHTGDVVMAIPPDLVLTESKMLLGRDYSVLIYWDSEEGVDWLLSTVQGWTEVKSLETGEQLSHEQATELLRNLIH